MTLEPQTFNTLPDGWRPAVYDDFHIGGYPRLGMQFIICGRENRQFELYTVSPKLRGSEIKPFIEQRRCWVKDESPKSQIQNSKPQV